MHKKRQSQLTSENKHAFFQKAYHHQLETKQQLVNLNMLKETTILLIDCCGWHYKKLFPNKNIIALETKTTVKTFDLDSTYFDQLFDTKSFAQIEWPTLILDSPAVVMDRSPLLRYRTQEQILLLLNNLTQQYMPETLLIEQALHSIDDCRLVDRFKNLSNLTIDSYIVAKFNYDSDTMRLTVQYRKKSQ